MYISFVFCQLNGDLPSEMMGLTFKNGEPINVYHEKNGLSHT
jgi:hypothetical protein